MGEPARKYQDIEPDIRPNLRVIKGGGEGTSERGNLKLVPEPKPDGQNVDELATRRKLYEQETNPEQPDTNTDNIEAAEEKANSGYINKYTGQREALETRRDKLARRGKAYLRLAKRKGPLTSIILTVIGGGIGLSTFFSPGLLIIHMKETMVNKFNVQLASMDVRTTKILKTKTTTGLLCSSFNRCKYSSMSDKQIAKFEKAGVKVNLDTESEPNLLGRRAVKDFEFEGKTISAGEFANEIDGSPKFRSAVRKAYNSKFAGFVDSIWDKISAKFHVSKATTEIAGATDEVSLKNIQDATSTGNKAVEPDEVYRQGAGPEKEIGDPAPKGQKWSKEEANRANDSVIRAANPPAAAVNEGANEVFNSGTKAGTEAAKEAADLLETGVKNIDLNDIPVKSFLNRTADKLKITDILDNACTIYRMVQALGYAAKVVRAVQLARFAMLFLNVADQIKAGDANPDDVSYLGKILTTEIGGTMALKSATDSFGYKFAAYGERGNMSTTASQFLAGGGLPGKLIGLTNTINSVLGGTPRATCKLLGNTFIGLASGVAGIAMMFMPAVGPVVFTGKTIAFGVAGLAFQVGLMLLPELLKDIVAGVLVDKTTVGEAAGDAYTSGASGIMGSLAQRGGNAPLTPAEAVAYNNLSKNVIAQYAEEDRLAYSPFDITNGNTFMGKIFAQLIPYASKMSSLSGILTSIASIPTRSLAMATSNNVMAAGSIEDYQMCQDMDYNNLNDSGEKLATDPYCNVMYGIPVGALETDPLDVVDALVDGGQIDEDGNIIADSDYEKFVTDCIARDRPLGDMGVDFSLSDGSECLFNNDTNKNYYLYYIDQRVLSGMEGEPMSIDPGTVPADGSTDSGSTDPGTIAPTEPELIDPGDIEPTTQTGGELIKNIIDKGNVYYQYSPITEKNLEGVNESLLWVLNDLSNRYRFTIWSLKRDGDPSASQHNTGRAVDIVTVNGAPVTSAYNQSIQDFLYYAAERAKIYSRTGRCGIGTQNSQYLSNMASQCTAFYDEGTGSHLHIDIRGG